MDKQISRSVGDYLKAIYSFTTTQETTTTLALAEQLAVAPSSVTSMLKKLAKLDPPLVNYQKSYGVSLTKEGRQAALRLIRRHRLLETFLKKVMGYQWEDIHSEADELEHVISTRFEEHMADLLGEPLFDPHGDPIPTRDLSLPTSNNIPLTQLSEGVSATIRRVHSNQSKLLQNLGDHGIIPGATINIDSRNPFDQTLQLSIGTEQKTYVIGPDLSKNIFVELIPEAHD
jgi:DtxR family Mn-dependent transcriptional regulator